MAHRWKVNLEFIAGAGNKFECYVNNAGDHEMNRFISWMENGMYESFRQSHFLVRGKNTHIHAQSW